MVYQNISRPLASNASVRVTMVGVVLPLQWFEKSRNAAKSAQGLEQTLMTGATLHRTLLNRFRGIVYA